jgi:hypothetical protein
MSYIDLNIFKARANISSTDTTQDAYLDWILSAFSLTIDRTAKTTFSLVSSQTSEKIFGWGNGQRTVQIGTWQASGLVVTYADSVTSTPVTLTLNTDYILNKPSSLVDYISATPLPAISITLITKILTKTNYIQVAGTYGYANALPLEIEIALYNSVLTAYAWNKMQGQGLVTVDVIEGLRTEFAVPDQYLTYASALASGNLLAVPSTRDLIMSYQIQSEEIARAM